LLVVGSHADRRKVQRQAREKGLKIIYADPEGFFDKNKVFTPYPMEAPKDEDLVLQITAEQFTNLWNR